MEWQAIGHRPSVAFRSGFTRLDHPLFVVGALPAGRLVFGATARQLRGDNGAKQLRHNGHSPRA
jgi:hypothetical protein